MAQCSLLTNSQWGRRWHCGSRPIRKIVSGNGMRRSLCVSSRTRRAASTVRTSEGAGQGDGREPVSRVSWAGRRLKRGFWPALDCYGPGADQFPTARPGARLRQLSRGDWPAAIAFSTSSAQSKWTIVLASSRFTQTGRPVPGALNPLIVAPVPTRNCLPPIVWISAFSIGMTHCEARSWTKMYRPIGGQPAARESARAQAAYPNAPATPATRISTNIRPRVIDDPSSDQRPRGPAGPVFIRPDHHTGDPHTSATSTGDRNCPCVDSGTGATIPPPRFLPTGHLYPRRKESAAATGRDPVDPVPQGPRRPRRPRLGLLAHLPRAVRHLDHPTGILPRAPGPGLCPLPALQAQADDRR